MTANKNPQDSLIEYKLLLIGESNVVKTTIFNKYIFNKLDKNTGSTIGVDFEAKNFSYKNKKYSIKLFDTAGQERFHSVTRAYYHMGDAYLIVFDLTNENSLKEIPNWINSLKAEKEDSKFIILGNKSDLKNQISQDVINEYLKDYKHLLIKTSAIKNENIKESIYKIIDLIEGDDNNLENKDDNDEQNENVIKISKKIGITRDNSKSKVKCC